MFANGAIKTMTDDDDRVYLDLASTIWHLMSTAAAMQQEAVDDNETAIITQTLDYISYTMLQLLQFELERREFGDPNEFLDLVDRLSAGLPPYED